MSFGVNDRFDQGGDQVEVMESDSTPYNKGQWRRLHIGNERDKHPGTGTKVNRNAHTLNDPAQTGMKPRRDYYSEGHNQNSEKGTRQYVTGLHEFSDQHTLRGVTVNDKKENVFHTNDPELHAPSFGHSLLNTEGYKSRIVEQVAPGGTNNIGQPTFDPPNPSPHFDPTTPTDMKGRPQLSNQFNRSSLSVEDLMSMYTLDESIPNFLTLDRTAKQNFMADITDVRKQV